MHFLADWTFHVGFLFDICAVVGITKLLKTF